MAFKTSSFRRSSEANALVPGLLCLLVGACDQPTRFALDVDRVHGSSAWKSSKALSMDIEIQGVGREPYRFKYLLAARKTRVRIEDDAGVVYVQDGERGWVQPSSAKGRPLDPLDTHFVRWAVGAPMVRHVDGAFVRSCDEYGFEEMQDACAVIAFQPRINFWSFHPGYAFVTDVLGGVTGQRPEQLDHYPDDYYVMCRAPETQLLSKLGYYDADGNGRIVVSYDGYVNVEGLRIASRWEVHRISSSTQSEGELVATATLSDFRFVDQKGAFDVPERAAPDDEALMMAPLFRSSVDQ